MRLLGNAFLAAAATLLTLGVAEAALRAVAPQPREGLIQVQDPASGLPVMRSSGSARHEAAGQRVRYHFSAPHLRGPAAAPDAFRVLVVGDSFTFGELLPDSATFVARIAQALRADPALRDVALLNGGGRGYGTAEMVRFIEQFGVRAQPAALLVFLNTDDIGRIVPGRLYAAQGDSLVPVPMPVARAKRWANALPGYAWLLDHSHLAAFVRRRLLVLLRGTRTPPSAESIARGPHRLVPEDRATAAVAHGRALFARLARWSQQHRVPLLVLTTGWADPARYGTPTDPTMRFLAQAPAFFSTLGVPYRDLAPTVAPVHLAHPERFAIAGDGHPSAAGAALIAEAATPEVARWLRALRAAPAR